MCGTCSQKRAMAKPVMQCCERHKGNKSCKSEKKPPKCKPKNICRSCGQDTALVEPGDHGCETKKPENSCESKKAKEKPKRSCGQRESKKCGHPEKAESEAKQCCQRPTPQKTCKKQKDQDKCGNGCQLKKAASQSTCEQNKPKKCGQPEKAESQAKNCCQRNKPQTTCASKKPKSSCEDASIKDSPCAAKESQQACSSPQNQDTFEYPQTLTKCKPICKNKCSRQPQCAAAGKQLGKQNTQTENNRTGGQCCKSKTENTQQAKGKCRKANQSIQSCESQKSKKSCGAERQPICLKKQQMQNAVQNGRAYLIDPISVLVPIRIKRKVTKKPACEKNDCGSVTSEPKSQCETDTEPEPPCMPEPVIEVEDECEPGPVRCPGGDTVMKHKLRKLKRRRSPNEPEMDTVHLASETTIFSFEESRSSFSTQNDDIEYLIKEIYYDDNESFTTYIS